MFRLPTVSSWLFCIAGVLSGIVFVLHIFTYSSNRLPDEVLSHPQKRFHPAGFFRPKWLFKKPTTIVFIPAEPYRDTTFPGVTCRENLIRIEQYRQRTMVRAVIVRYPSSKPDYFFVQFRWFYRSWIESEMYTLEHWRTDLVILIDHQLPQYAQVLLEELDCRVENERTSRRQFSRCILVKHRLFSQRDESIQKFLGEQFSALNGLKELDENVERLYAMYDFTSHLNASHAAMYNFVMVTTMNTFLTTQFGKYVPLKCAFLIGASPDYSTWYGKTDQIIQFSRTLLGTLHAPQPQQPTLSTAFIETIDKMKKNFPFVENQVDIPCDSTMTTFRTLIFHLKCYAHSTSLFSEKMFRQNSYDGNENQPFNIYIAREYATFIALKSKIMSLKELKSLAFNVTRRENRL